jgi:hypothetical protein
VYPFRAVILLLPSKQTNSLLRAAALSSGLARLWSALKVRGSNPGVDTGEKGKKGTNHLSPFFELYRISLVHKGAVVAERSSELTLIA